MTTKEKLLAIANHVEHNIPDEEFDLCSWKCDTVGCAIGHSANIPEFKEMGFSLRKDVRYDQLIPVFGKYDSWEAVEKFLEIDCFDAEYLFSASSYREYQDKNIVINRIRSYVSEYFPS